MNTEKRSQNPYVGPRAFEEGEPLFGRSLEELQLFQLLVARRIALLHSPSGAGKTSLVQAGLIPRLKADGFHVLPIARLNEKPPESPPSVNEFNRYIYSLLLSLQERPEDRLDEKLASLSLSEYLEPYHLSEADPELLVLIVDQLEEVLTADPTDIDQKLAFFAEVGRALRKPNLWALFVIREDYLGALEPYVRAIPTRLSNTFRLDLLGTAAASDAISKPAEIQGVQFTDRAVETLVDDLRRIQVQQPDGKVVEQPGPYVEPVQLQVVCYRLWQELSPGQTEITQEKLKTVGNVDESLAAYYAEKVKAIEADPETGAREREVRRWVHDKLTTKDDIRLPVLKGQGQTEGLDNRVIGMLEDAHLIRAEERAGMTWYELAHDRLVKPVRGDNVKWFNKHLSLLQRQAQRWQGEGGPEYLLLRGQALERAQDWAEHHPDELSKNDQTFLEASRKEHEREEEKRAAKIRELELQQQQALAEEQRKRAEEAEAAKNKYRRLTRIAFGILAAAILAFVLAVVLGVVAIRESNVATTAVAQASNAAVDAVEAQATATAAVATAAAGAAKVQTTVTAAVTQATAAAKVAQATVVAAMTQGAANAAEVVDTATAGAVVAQETIAAAVAQATYEAAVATAGAAEAKPAIDPNEVQVVATAAVARADAAAAGAQATSKAAVAQATAAAAVTEGADDAAEVVAAATATAAEAQTAVAAAEATANTAVAEAATAAAEAEAKAATAATEAQAAVAAAEATATAADTVTSTPPPNPSEGEKWTRQKDGVEVVMVYVPGGTFTMGSDTEDNNPKHKVTLGGFWIDRTEVTQEQFDRFVADTGHVTTAEEQGYGEIHRDDTWQRVPDIYWNMPHGSEDDRESSGRHPVVQVSWVDASKYCTWAGGRLPTEAQWEYAARGPDNRVYPWGDEWDGSRLNYCDDNCPFAYRDTGQDDGYAETAPVASYSPGGDSWIDAADMAGNVWEWVADWYGENYYDISPLENPTGPDSGTEKVVRGGGWSTTDKFVQSGNRHWVPPTDRRSNRGFRCAITPRN